MATLRNLQPSEKTPSMRNKAPWKPGERICSLEELYRAADIRLSRKVPIAKYFRDLEETLEKAKLRLMEQDLQYAYVFYLRYVTVVIKHLPNMPDYDKPEHAKSRERASKNAKKALTVLERLQPLLVERYEEYVKYLSTLPRPKAAVSTYSTRHGISGRKISNPFEGVVGDSGSAAPPRTMPQGDRPIDAGLVKQPARFSLTDTLQGLHIGSHSSVRLPVKPKEELPVTYPSISATNHSSTQSSQPRSASVASLHAYPQPIFEPPPPALPPRPESARYSPKLPQNASNCLSAPAITPPHHSQTPKLQPPPQGNIDAPRPVLPPKPLEYHDNTPPGTAGAESFMPPCFINAAHSSLTEGGVRMRPIQVPEGIFEEFIDIASKNTRSNLETCGILCGKQIPGQEALVMTTLIIPKQRATSDTCVTEHEEELFVEQMDRDLITLGWIHTHPSQTCFMSSLDLHTQCSYQLMLPEAIAIVCSPQHDPRFGIFRLTDPMGIDTIQSCKEKSAFHPHDDSKVIYTNASDGSHVVLANYDFDIVDIRGVL
ncbi:hypothetical protein LPJ63_000478 [Coemansia sp. RSA 2711]|nr:hypothetical protein LPJ63_000478 [Coemansia sp. RSA 2711]KAJ2315793.1 hypothetical protein IWW54_000034 [Coemansia sp. RSA 2705]